MRASAVAGGPEWSRVFEDVFIGFALSQLAPGPPLVLVGFEQSVYGSERWGVHVAPSTMLWHAKAKEPARVRTIDAWKARHHCARRSPQLPRCERHGRACSGAIWLHCSDGGPPPPAPSSTRPAMAAAAAAVTGPAAPIRPRVGAGADAWAPCSHEMLNLLAAQPEADMVAGLAGAEN